MVFWRVIKLMVETWIQIRASDCTLLVGANTESDQIQSQTAAAAVDNSRRSRAVQTNKRTSHGGGASGG